MDGVRVGDIREVERGCSMLIMLLAEGGPSVLQSNKYRYMVRIRIELNSASYIFHSIIREASVCI